jgi:hypothetical protein
MHFRFGPSLFPNQKPFFEIIAVDFSILNKSSLNNLFNKEDFPSP